MKELLPALLCDRCGYDLRVQPPSGACPECGLPVAESRRLAAIPRRPRWAESDPAWRRRVVAGVWLWTLLPLVRVLQASGLKEKIPVPHAFDSMQTIHSFADTLASLPDIYEPIVFCMGTALLCSRERWRRPTRMDWTRRWGVGCSYVVPLLALAPTLFVAALILAGIASLFVAMPLQYQPKTTPLFVTLSTNYLWYGPCPHPAVEPVLATFSSVAVLLVCVALFDALRSARSNRTAAIVLAPLVLIALMQLWQMIRHAIGLPGLARNSIELCRLYFSPGRWVWLIRLRIADWNAPSPELIANLIEGAKECIVLGIAVGLSLAQLLAIRRRRKRRYQDNARPLA